MSFLTWLRNRTKNLSASPSLAVANGWCFCRMAGCGGWQDFVEHFRDGHGTDPVDSDVELLYRALTGGREGGLSRGA